MNTELPTLSTESWMTDEHGHKIPLYHGDDVDERERILMVRIVELQEEADRRTQEVEATYHVQSRLNARIAVLEAVCAGHYANTVEALRQANEADARVAELEADRDSWKEQAEARVEDWAKEYERAKQLEAALAECVALAEWWINYKREPRMCERDYRTWLALGHHSESLLHAKAVLAASRQET